MHGYTELTNPIQADPALRYNSGQALLTYNALLEMADRLAVAMAGHERAAELHEFFEAAYHAKLKEMEMEAQLVEAERLGEKC